MKNSTFPCFHLVDPSRDRSYQLLHLLHPTTSKSYVAECRVVCFPSEKAKDAWWNDPPKGVLPPTVIVLFREETVEGGFTRLQPMYMYNGEDRYVIKYTVGANADLHKLVKSLHKECEEVRQHG